MNILFANARPPYPFVSGGDTMNIHSFFTFLSRRGHQCFWLGTSVKKDTFLLPSKLKRLQYLFVHGYYPGISIRWNRHTPSVSITYKKEYISREVHPKLFISELRKIMQKDRPDIVVTQLEQADKVIGDANTWGIPSVIFLTDGEKSSIARITNLISQKPSAIVCVSKFVRSKLKETTNIPSTIIYPPIIPTDYISRDSHDNHKYITCINPVLNKGGAILEKIIQRFPKEHFLVVKGWYDPKDDGLNFDKYANVRVLEKTHDMKNIYKKTSLLLVPSLWDEALPRVILEAGVSGIPSVASRRGGISEAQNTTTTIVDDPLNISSWIHAITSLLTNKRAYQRASRSIKKHVSKFYIEKSGIQFERLLQRLITQTNNRNVR